MGWVNEAVPDTKDPFSPSSSNDTLPAKHDVFMMYNLSMMIGCYCGAQSNQRSESVYCSGSTPLIPETICAIWTGLRFRTSLYGASGQNNLIVQGASSLLSGILPPPTVVGLLHFLPVRGVEYALGLSNLPFLMVT